MEYAICHGPQSDYARVTVPDGTALDDFDLAALCGEIREQHGSDISHIAIVTESGRLLDRTL